MNSESNFESLELTVTQGRNDSIARFIFGTQSPIPRQFTPPAPPIPATQSVSPARPVPVVYSQRPVSAIRHEPDQPTAPKPHDSNFINEIHNFDRSSKSVFIIKDNLIFCRTKESCWK